MKETVQVESLEPIMITDYPKTDIDDWPEFGDHSICTF